MLQLQHARLSGAFAINLEVSSPDVLLKEEVYIAHNTYQMIESAIILSATLYFLVLSKFHCNPQDVRTNLPLHAVCLIAMGYNQMDFANIDGKILTNAAQIHQARYEMIVKSNADFAVVSLNRFNDIETALHLLLLGKKYTSSVIFLFYSKVAKP